MSSTKFSFKAKIKVGGEVVPLASEVAFGDTSAENGVKNGFIFKLDQKEEEDPVQIDLGAIIKFISEKLDGGDLSKNSGVITLKEIFPEEINSKNNFDESNSTIIEIKAFQINSSKKEKLFSINVNLIGSDPDKGLITFPDEVSEWLKIKNLGISFSAKKKSESTPTLEA
ncbi:MAG: hypothetical protein ACSHX0_10170 [Akkermansiaceae bacterium]